MTELARQSVAVEGFWSGLPVRERTRGLELPDDISLEDWMEVGRRLGMVAENLSWKIGDWCNAAELRDGWGTKYDEMMALTGYDYGTLRNMSSVAGRFELERRTSASFSHHAEVVSLPLEEADAMLARSKEHGWTKHELREHVADRKAALRGEPPKPKAAVVSVTVTVSDGDYDAWLTAAADVEIRRWIVDTCNREAAPRGRTLTA